MTNERATVKLLYSKLREEKELCAAVRQTVKAMCEQTDRVRGQSSDVTLRFRQTDFGQVIAITTSNPNKFPASPTTHQA